MKLVSLASAVVLMTVPQLHAAESERVWSAIGEEGGVSFFADLTTIDRQSGNATMWMLSDFAEAREDRSSGEAFVSQMGFFEFDCQQTKSRILYYSRHTEHQAGGETIFERDLPDNDWRPVPEETQRDAERMLACD